MEKPSSAVELAISPIKRSSLAQTIAHKLRELIAQRKLQG